MNSSEKKTHCPALRELESKMCRAISIAFFIAVIFIAGCGSVQSSLDSSSIEDVVTKGSLSELFILAAIEGHPEQASLLLDKGAHINAKLDLYKKRNIKITHIRNPEALSKRATALIYATHLGHEAVATLLINRGADVNSKDDNGRTALMFAVHNKSVALAKLLIEKGADVNAVDSAGWSPLTWVHNSKSTDRRESMVQLLTENGAYKRHITASVSLTPGVQRASVNGKNVDRDSTTKIPIGKTRVSFHFHTLDYNKENYTTFMGSRHSDPRIDKCFHAKPGFEYKVRCYKTCYIAGHNHVTHEVYVIKDDSCS